MAQEVREKLLGYRGWDEIEACEDLCTRAPCRVQRLLGSLDLEREGLASVKKAEERQDLTGACEALIDYVSGEMVGRWEPSRQGSVLLQAADDALRDTFTIQGVTAAVPRREDGGIDWYFGGPREDPQFAYLFNRHAFFSVLLLAWTGTGDERYAEAFDRFVRDWTLHCPGPEARTNDADWMPIQVGLRACGSWPSSFFGFLPTRSFTDAGRVLMLCSFAEHAAYLLAHWGGMNPNITLMELNGLGHIAALFPEFRDAAIWRATAEREMTRQLEAQVYPDGAQKELTLHYHEVARRHFETFAQVLEETSQAAPPGFRETLDAMLNYTASVLRPDGHIPLNNDSDRDDKHDALMQAAEARGRPDWAYIVTNGMQGERPPDPPSRAFRWAGQLVSRSGWDADAHWSFFDVGPWGAAHQHNDKLHLSVSAFGRDLLVDSGRFAYSGVVGSRFRRPYAAHSRGHNVILVDGCGQAPGPRTANRPLRETDLVVRDTWDFARASVSQFEDLAGFFRHERTLVYLRGRFWVVVDRFETDRPRQLEALWHFHPDCRVTVDGASLLASRGNRAHLGVRPAGSVRWEIEIQKGQEDPAPQGWYSERYNDVRASPCAVYRSEIDGPSTASWAIVPSPDGDVLCAIESVLEEDGLLVVSVGDLRIRLHADGCPVEVEG